MSIGIAAHHKMPAQGLVQQTSWLGVKTLVASFTIEPPEFFVFTVRVAFDKPRPLAL